MSALLPHGSLLVGYVATCLLLAVTPGADMALFLARTLAGGRKQGFAAQAGSNVGLLVHTSAAALGLSALLAASAQAYLAVKITGALYLLWLGFQALSKGTAPKLEAGAEAGDARGAFWSGLLITLTNPKIMLFFVGFLPQFIDAGEPAAGAKLLALGLGFLVLTTLVNALVILVAARFVGAARAHPRALRGFDYAFAALMSAFAVRLVWAQGR